MTYPRTYRAFRRTISPYPRSVVLTTETLPESLGTQQVLIRIRAVSLNYRDVAMLHEGRYPVPVDDGGIVASDCAAEVVAVGAEVKEFAIGDRVSPTINLASLTGEEKDEEPISLGGNGPGVLREYAIFEEKHLVKVPQHLSWEEASTIVCAGITAWVALDRLKGSTEGATALLQGTGGVSMFSLLLCLAAGIQPIITSSSDEKLKTLSQLDPRVQGINYKRCTDVAEEALRLTGGKGVDYVINNAGLPSIPSDLKSLRKLGGTIALIGFLEGFQINWSPEVLFTLIAKAARLQGILGGSKVDFENLNKFLEEKKVSLLPLIDRVFSFEEAPQAMEYLGSGKHTGKVVIKL